MKGRVFGLLLLAVACRETSTGRGTPDTGQSSLAGKWQGITSVDPQGPGALARMELEDAPGGQVIGVLNVSFDMDANDLGTIGILAGPAQGGHFSRGPLLSDGGFEARYTLTVTPSSSLNHVEMVEQHKDLDGASFPVYYRMDRQ